MDWKTMQAEWRKLGTLIDGWAQTDEIPAVERDLALEKLRVLYDAIRFAGTASAQEPERMSAERTETQEEILPESIDLGEMLSMEEFPDLGESAGPIFVEPAASFVAEREPAEKAETAAAEEAPSAAGPQSVTAEEALSAAGPQSVTAEEADRKESAIAGPVVEPDVTLDPLVAEDSGARSAASPEASLTEKTDETPETAAEMAPETTPSESARHRQTSPTLFGMEDEETLRHRHKQRVIMSLYGPSPEPERRSTTSGHDGLRSAPTSHETTSLHAESNLPNSDIEDFDLVEVTLTPEVASTLTARSVSDPSAETPSAESPATEIPSAETPSVEVPDRFQTESQSAEPVAEPLPEASDSEDPDFEPTLSEITISESETGQTAAVGPAAAPESFTGTFAEPETTQPAVNTAMSDSPESAAGSEGVAEPSFSAGSGIPGWQEVMSEADAVLDGQPLHPQGGAVLGEVINPHVQTLADTIAPPHDIASELRRNEPVTDLRRAIGLNDKFLLIRDLFGGDAQAYERAIETLNDFDDLDDCMIFIAEHYAWNPNSDGAKLMMELLERKFA